MLQRGRLAFPALHQLSPRSTRLERGESFCADSTPQGETKQPPRYLYAIY